jgi:succinate-semialdehyde dehydrogenase / glutarate-semialdehyde dehydrogenase
MIISKNPATEEILASYNELSSQEIEAKLSSSATAFQAWRFSTVETRKQVIEKLINVLETNKHMLGELITLEMGKPLPQSISEIEKCISLADYYIKNIDTILAHETISTKASESYISFEPLGTILAVMPWNFPFWQVLRFAIPAIMAGNCVVLKHASNVPNCAREIEKLLIEAGLPEGIVQTLLISSSQVEPLIHDDRIAAITLTGSEYAGSQVGAAAGKALKKTVLELGGCDPFIVMGDADIELSCKGAFSGRLKNNGQACNAAKRFILLEDIAEQFISRYVEMYKEIKIGNPMDTTTDIGPLATQSIVEEVDAQVQKSLELGAKVLVGGNRISGKGYYFEPTILTNISKGMPAYDQEIFGPVASIIVVPNIEEAIRVANDTEFGLGASIWTKDIQKAKQLIPQIQSGSVFINSPVSSDPHLPFGGIKKSGYGREMSHYGIREFMNIKTVWVN